MHKKSRIGEERLNKYGELMVIVDYNSSTDMTVRFFDGTQRTGVSYQSFKTGNVCRVKRNRGETRIGEIRYNNKGERMKIIKYNSSMDITVEFDDGTKRDGVSYSSFKSGTISKKRVNRLSNEEFYLRVGETNYNTKGELMTILKYNNYSDIEVQFEDGTIKSGVSYQNFKSGKVSKSNDKIDIISHVGETGINYEGYKMRIIKYESSTNIDVQFEDGCITKGILYSRFKQGKVTKSHVGETNINIAGEKIKILTYHNSKNIDVQFEDGTILEYASYSDFKKGWVIKNPYGQVGISKNGERVRIVNRRGAVRVDVKFEDGTLLVDVPYEDFLNGNLSKTYKNDKVRCKKIGEIGINIKGVRMKIVNYRDSRDIDVVSEKGILKKGVSYSSFKRGTILFD